MKWLKTNQWLIYLIVYNYTCTMHHNEMDGASMCVVCVLFFFVVFCCCWLSRFLPFSHSSMLMNFYKLYGHWTLKNNVIKTHLFNKTGWLKCPHSLFWFDWLLLLHRCRSVFKHLMQPNIIKKVIKLCLSSLFVVSIRKYWYHAIYL